jgi:hypothetical protein
LYLWNSPEQPSTGGNPQIDPADEGSQTGSDSDSSDSDSGPSIVEVPAPAKVFKLEIYDRRDGIRFFRGLSVTRLTVPEARLIFQALIGDRLSTWILFSLTENLHCAVAAGQLQKNKTSIPWTKIEEEYDTMVLPGVVPMVTTKTGVRPAKLGPTNLMKQGDLDVWFKFFRAQQDGEDYEDEPKVSWEDGLLFQRSTVKRAGKTFKGKNVSSIFRRILIP